MIAADLARAVIVLGMLTVQTKAGVPFLYLLLLLETLMWAFFEPGRTALTPVLTNSEAELTAANGLSSMTWSVSLALGSGRRSYRAPKPTKSDGGYGSKKLA